MRMVLSSASRVPKGFFRQTNRFDEVIWNHLPFRCRLSATKRADIPRYLRMAFFTRSALPRTAQERRSRPSRTF